MNHCSRAANAVPPGNRDAPIDAANRLTCRQRVDFLTGKLRDDLIRERRDESPQPFRLRGVAQTLGAWCLAWHPARLSPVRPPQVSPSLAVCPQALRLSSACPAVRGADVEGDAAACTAPGSSSSWRVVSGHAHVNRLAGGVHKGMVQAGGQPRAISLFMAVSTLPGHQVAAFSRTSGAMVLQ
jgi:hypothetical protein